MDQPMKIPMSVKIPLFLVGLVALLFVLYVAKGIILPLIFAVIISIVLHPIVNFFINKKINRLVAIVITLFLSSLIITAFGLLVVSQVSRLSESWPMLIEKFTAILNQSISDIAGYLDIKPKKIHEWIDKSFVELMNSSTAAIGKTLAIVGSILVVILLIPVYIFLILFYKPLLIEFIRRVFGPGNRTMVNGIVTQIKTVIQHYLVGLVIEITIVAILETTALLILGIEYAILLGILGALFNLIPYIGTLIGVVMPMVVALITKDSAWYAIYILISYQVIQFIDNNVIVPKIVASKVKINALFSIIAVIAGNALWGIPGMLLSIPLLAIIKLVFDKIEPLKPWGFLLGDTMPSILKIKPLLKKKPL